MSNRNMNTAKVAKNDEFYTQLKDIENEMRHYKPHFKDKVIYMNCDHPDRSNFWLFFKLQFNHLKPKRVISTFYNEDGESFKTVYDGVEEVRTPLKGDGDFRSDECVAILKESDVIATNPPFSLFREFIALIMELSKGFLVLGNNNAITYKETFPLIKDNKMWLGMTNNTTMEFEVPDDYPLVSKGGRVDSDGTKFLKVPAITWFTNLDYPKRHEDMLLWASYKGSEDEYPEYDNIKAINIDRVAYIPYDYEGVMGVPISFIGRWNPSQFEILGIDDDVEHGDLTYLKPEGWVGSSSRPIVNDKGVYRRILIRNKKPKKELF